MQCRRKKRETARRMEYGEREDSSILGRKEMIECGEEGLKRRQQSDAFKRSDDRYNVESIRRSAATESYKNTPGAMRLSFLPVECRINELINKFIRRLCYSHYARQLQIMTRITSG